MPVLVAYADLSQYVYSVSSALNGKTIETDHGRATEHSTVPPLCFYCKGTNNDKWGKEAGILRKDIHYKEKPVVFQTNVSKIITKIVERESMLKLNR